MALPSLLDALERVRAWMTNLGDEALPGDMIEVDVMLASLCRALSGEGEGEGGGR